MPRAHPSVEEPCLCGSGRPFGRCCAAAFASDISAWERARDAERRVIEPIAAYALSTWGPGLLRQAWRLFSIGHHSPESLQGLLPVFDPWLVFTWVANLEIEMDLETPKDWPTAALGLAWLASGSANVSHGDQAFIVAAVKSPYSLLLVEATTPGWFLTVRDLMTGRRFRLVDPEVSRAAPIEDILLGAVVTLDGVSTLLGAASYTIPSDWRFEARDIRKCYDGEPWLTRAEALDVDLDLFDSFRDAYDRGAAGETGLFDVGADPCEPLLLRWTVASPFHDALERLRPLSCAYDDEAIDLENGPDGQPGVLMTWYQRGASADPDDWKMLGSLYLEEGRLAADVPTRALADRLIAEVAVRFGSGAAFVGERPGGRPVRVHMRKSRLYVLIG